MTEKSITVLFIADIVGRSGFDIVSALLPNLKKTYHVDLCIVNGENADNGNGITETISRQFFSIGVDIITGGNHTWNHAAFRQHLDVTNRILRPLNYPQEAPGNGSTVFFIKDKIPVAIINLQGRTFMYPIDCPFKRGHESIIRLREQTKIIFIDFHAEATAEKMALAWYLDGKVSAIIGTHTHVQTADERIFPMGTAYITDAGMTGPHDSVIGMDPQIAIKRFITQLPEKYRVASSNIRLCGVVVDIDIESGKALKILRLNLP